MMIKFPLFIAYYLLISSAAWEKRRFFPKKSLPAILNFASYIPARRGEVSELVEGARLEIVCTLKAYQEFESLPLRHRENSPLSNQRVFSFMVLPEQAVPDRPFSAPSRVQHPPGPPLHLRPLVFPSPSVCNPRRYLSHFLLSHRGTTRHIRATAGRRQCRPHLQQ